MTKIREKLYEIALLCLSVRLSLNFLKIFSRSNIVHYESLPRYLVTDKARFLKKNFNGPNLGLAGLNQAQNDKACITFKQILEVKTHKKNLGPKFGSNGPKSVPKLNLNRIIAWNKF